MVWEIRNQVVAERKYLESFEPTVRGYAASPWMHPTYSNDQGTLLKVVIQNISQTSTVITDVCVMSYDIEESTLHTGKASPDVVPVEANKSVETPVEIKFSDKGWKKLTEDRPDTVNLVLKGEMDNTPMVPVEIKW